MIRNFIKIAFRFLWRNKTYTILNYLCLTFGLSFSIIAMLHINRMQSFDKFHASMPLWPYIAGPFIAYIIGLSAVSLQSWRAATRNPVEALRCE
jgi:ABC-type antimicrobial peptide transport system permease subunit